MRALLATALAAVVLVPGVAEGRPVDAPVAFPRADSSHECLEAVPEAASIVGVTDDGEVVEAEVLVLLDGITRADGRDIVRVAQESYDPLQVVLRPRFRAVRLPDEGVEPGMDDVPGPTAEGLGLIEEARKAVGGARPEGFDLVLVLTDKDLFYVENGQRQYGLAGVADCIGGIRYDEHAFAVSEGITPWAELIGDTAPGMFAAHELGHLFGAHHHYADCAEGAEPDKPCTLMWTISIDLVSRNFGTLEAATIRGHAVSYAR